MDSLSFDITEPTQWEGIGPHPSHMAVSRLYVLQPDIDAALDAIGMTESRDSQLRLEGANFIDALRKAMSLCGNLGGLFGAEPAAYGMDSTGP